MTGSNGFIGNYFTNKYKDKYDIEAFSFLKDDFESLHVGSKMSMGKVSLKQRENFKNLAVKILSFRLSEHLLFMDMALKPILRILQISSPKSQYCLLET